MTNYSNESIDQLDGAERVRRRPAAVLGSDGLAGALHGITEIIGNAIDESTAGFGDKLHLTLKEDGGVIVRDFGRGVPMGWNKNKEKMNWFLVFNEMYAGGKYEDYQDELRAIKDWSTFNPHDYNYLFSIGLNGLGAASTQYSSEYFYVESHREGEMTSMSFKNGYPVLKMPNGETIVGNSANIKDWKERTGEDFEVTEYKPYVTETEQASGTHIEWKPDIKVFSEVDVTIDWLRDKAEAVAHASGVSVVVKDDMTGKVYEYEKGSITDFNLSTHRKVLLDEDSPTVYEDTTLTHGEITGDSRGSGGERKIYVCQADISIVRTTERGREVCFHNAIKMRGGAQYWGIQDALLDFFYLIGKDKGINLKATDWSGKLGIIVNSYSNLASYKGQTKEEVDDTFIRLTVSKLIKDLLNKEYHKGTGDIKELVEEVVAEAEVRIELAKQQKALREVSKATRTRKLPKKFIPSTNFNERRFGNSELWIVEGDSASNSVEAARDSAFQAIYAIRGKMTNALKASLEKILGTQEIKELFALAGTGMEVTGVEEESFDLSASRFSKYVIGTDADEDGYQIRVLVFCAFWKLAPQIIENGMLYIAESPKFEITLRDNSVLYAVNSEEYANIKEEYGSQIKKVQRFKGLGQVNADVLAETTMKPESRRMIQIQLNPADYSLNSVIETVFGKDPFKQRKETLMSVLGSDVIDMFEDNAEIMSLIDKGVYEDDVEEVEDLIMH